MHKRDYLRGMHYRRLQEDAKKTRRLPSDVLFKCSQIKEELLSSAVIEIASREYVELEEK